MPALQIHPLQIPHHRLSAASAKLLVQGFEVSAVTTPNIAYRHRSVSSLETAGWDYPTGFGEHHYMQTIRDPNKVNALPLNWQRGLSYHSLKSPNASLVATPIGFVSNKQHTILQVAVEFSDHLFAARHLKSMGAENPLETSN
jgi:hypothetical protein